MTTADVETTKRRTTTARTETAGTITGDLVDAGTVLADRGVKLARTAAETGLKISDVVVTGTLGIAEDWAAATPISGLTVPPVKVARESWATTHEGLREFVAAV
jgi:hypothetical protein